MMIESDIMYALVKSEDWLKPAATSFLKGWFRDASGKSMRTGKPSANSITYPCREGSPLTTILAG